MRDHYFYAQSAHEAFSRIQPLAEKITEEATTQSEQGAPWLIGYDAVDYSRKTLEQLADFNSHIWQLRLALMWDYLPSCRPAVLVRCRTSSEEITRYLNDYLEDPQKIQVEWVRRMHKETLPRFLKE